MVLQDLITSLPETIVSDKGEEFMIAFNHLGLLYCMDTDKDGRYY